MCSSILITPDLPPTKPYAGYRRWLAGFKIVRKACMEKRVKELDKMEAERQSVEFGVCEFLNENHSNLTKHWGEGVPIMDQPFCISSDGLERLENNHSLKTATVDQLAIFEKTLSESEFRDLHGFDSTELFARKLDYLRSVKPDELTEFDETKLYTFDSSWIVIVSFCGGKPSLACLGVANDPIDIYFPNGFPNVGKTKPVWERTIENETGERQ